jgi:hypothetical protein
MRSKHALKVVSFLGGLLAASIAHARAQTGCCE